MITTPSRKRDNEQGFIVSIVRLYALGFQGGDMIRHFRPSDMESVLALETDCFPKSPYSQDMFEYIHSRDDVIFYVYEDDGKIIGDMAFEKEGHAITLAVRTDNRRKGVGKELMMAARDALSGRFLYFEVRESNSGAKLFYESLGGKKVGIIEEYYTDPRERAEVWVIAPGESTGNPYPFQLPEHVFSLLVNGG